VRALAVLRGEAGSLGSEFAAECFRQCVVELKQLVLPGARACAGYVKRLQVQLDAEGGVDDEGRRDDRLSRGARSDLGRPLARKWLVF
jgi:hypothetical protein